jgi:hypothetical protein
MHQAHTPAAPALQTPPLFCVLPKLSAASGGKCDGGVAACAAQRLHRQRRCPAGVMCPFVIILDRPTRLVASASAPPLAQAADIRLHLAALQQLVPQWIPDENFDGNAVLDFEAWSPVFDQNTGDGSAWHGQIYQVQPPPPPHRHTRLRQNFTLEQNMSVDIVRAMYPSMDPATATAIARVQFETSAVNFMVSTLLVVPPPPPPPLCLELIANCCSCVGRCDHAPCGASTAFLGTTTPPASTPPPPPHSVATTIRQ